MPMPMTPGLQDGDKLVNEDRKLKGMRTMPLKDLVQDYVPFTYAPLFLYGGLEHDPVAEWLATTDNSGGVVRTMLTKEVILEMGVDRKSLIWDRFVWLAARNVWQDLALHLGSIALIDKGKKNLTRVICQELPILENSAMDNWQLNQELPVVKLYSFSVDSNRGCLAFLPINKDGPIPSRPILKLYPPRDETTKMASLLFVDSNPYDQIQRYPWENE